MKKEQGFTLVELLIVIVIVGILGGVAYPSYQSYMIQTRRGEAKTQLIKAQLKQTNLHILNPNFSAIESSIGLPANDNYYTFSVVSAGTTTYLLKAVAKSGTTQAQDELACRILFIDQSSTHTNDGSTINEQCW